MKQNGKNSKQPFEKIFTELAESFDELKESMEDIRSSNSEINNSIEMSIEHCRINKKILKEIRKKVSTYKTRPAAEK